MSPDLGRRLLLLAARAASPRVRVEHLVPSAILVSLLALSPPMARIDGPLTDLVLASLPHDDERAEIVVVDLASWSLDSIPERATSRRQVAALIELLAADERRAVGLDVLLVDPTLEDADAELAAVLVAHPRVVVAASLETHTDAASDGAEARFPATRNPLGWIHVALDAQGRVDSYGLPGGLPESLAGQLARQMDPGIRIPSRPVLVQVPGFARDLTHRWAVVSAPELLAHPAAAEAFPSPAVILVGLAGEPGAALDGHRIRGVPGREPVPGILLHALMVEQMLSGSVVVEGGWIHQLAAAILFLSTILIVGRGVSWIRKKSGRADRRSRAAGVAAVALATPLALPYAVVFTGVTGASVSIGALLLAPPAMFASAYVSAAVYRRLIHRRAVGGGAHPLPTAVSRSLRAAFLDENASTRLSSLLDAYEDLIYSLVVLLLASREYPRRPARTARDLWHRQHTLPAVLATFATLEPELGARIGAHSRCDGDPMARQLLDKTAGGEGADSNGFVALRNTLAHDTTALWLTEDTASALCSALRRQLVAILRLPEVDGLLRGLQVDEARPPPAAGEDGAPLAAQLRTPGPGGTPRSAGPWLVWLATGGQAAPRLFRYRGLARRKDWITEDHGPVKTVCFTPFGMDHEGERSEVLLPASRIADQMPRWLRIDYDGGGVNR